MKIIVVSDSHGDTAILNNVFEKEKDADLFIHCGDYCLPEYMMNIWRHVRGNCDWTIDAPLTLDIETSLGNIHVEHGNNYNMMNDFINYVKKTNSIIFLSGHTHHKYASKIGDTFYFNPGSLTHPSDSNFGSYLVLDLDEKDKSIKHKFMKVDLQTGEIEEDKKAI
jgi:uncharacterized protein